MILVLIHWRIKPTLEAETEFFDYWRNTAKIDDKSNLAGEFLSAPIPAKDLPFRSDDLSLSPGLLDCRHYVNVGYWKDWDSFNKEVGKHMKDDKPLQPFEADRRTRTVLDAKHWRIGSFSLPKAGTCE